MLASNGVSKGLTAKDVYQVGAYQLNKTSKTPCAIIARPPSSHLVPAKNLSSLNLADVNLSAGNNVLAQLQNA
jgi:hypothetical protein